MRIAIAYCFFNCYFRAINLDYAETAERKCEYCDGFDQNATVANDFDGADYCHRNHGFGRDFDAGFGTRKHYFRKFFFDGIEYFFDEPI